MLQLFFFLKKQTRISQNVHDLCCIMTNRPNQVVYIYIYIYLQEKCHQDETEVDKQ